jgi:YD repeat-containing protein
MPTGKFSVTSGAPYFITEMPTNTAGRWKSIRITSGDESSVTFTPDPLDATRYVLSQITNLVGRSLYVVRDPRLGGRITAVTDDSVRPNTLLSFTYDAAGYLASVRNTCGQRVDYTCGPATGTTCLLSVFQIRTATFRLLPYWTYTYGASRGSQS